MKPKTLLLDIETQPDLVYVWGVYEQNAISVLEHWQILSYAAQWLGVGKPWVKALPDYKGYKKGGSDKKLVQDLWQLMNEADIIIAHNGKQFDMRKINARFIFHGLTPPAPYKIIDTRLEVAKVAGFSSNKLDWLCQQLEIGKKIEHEGFPMWYGCMHGDMAAWAKMKKYNKHDIELLRELYILIAPWIRQPNANIFDPTEARCTNPACGSQDLQKRGIHRARTRVYQRWSCNKCGAWSRSRSNEKGVVAKMVSLANAHDA